MKLDAVLYIHISSEEKKIIQDAAKKEGRSVENYVRYTLIKIIKGDK